MNVRRCLLFLLPLALSLLLAAAPVLAETINCTAITSVPFTISAAGIYCLTDDLDYTTGSAAAAIQIDASHVVLDLNGWSLKGESTYGVAAGPDVRHVTVKNGTIRGFVTGVYLGNPFDTDSGRTSGAVVERIHVLGPSRDTLTVPVGIMVGRSAIVRRNVVSDLTFTQEKQAYSVIGIQAGHGTRVIDNDVMRIRAVGTSDVWANAVGIYLEHGAIAIENRITDVSSPASAFGVSCLPSTPMSRIRGNVVMSAATSYTGCKDLGNND